MDPSPEPGLLPLVQGLFVKHQPVVRATILAVLPDFDLVDDVVQETFLTVTRKAGDFQPGTNFSAWVCAIARFKALEARRHGPLHFQTLSETVIESLCAVEPPVDDFDRRVRHFEGCLEELAPQARRAMELRYRGAHLPGAIASQMGWTVGAVKVALSRARAVLRDCVERRLAAETSD
ncbi:MAG: sigma-70 family RNA polymerase sigma factor [Limisphaerales bacterium]